MLPRLLTILLTLALPLQGLAVPHVHAVAGESEPDGHDHRPHFHFGGCHGHHGHCEGHRHSHRHEAAEDRSGSDETPVPCAPGSHSSSDHDDDAVYVSSDLAITGSSTTLLDLETSCAAIDWLSVEALPTSGHFFWVDAAARPPSFGGVPLYLSTLTLRL